MTDRDPAPAARTRRTEPEPEPDEDVRNGPIPDVGDPKDHPVLPDDVSETADPDNPRVLRKPDPK